MVTVTWVGLMLFGFISLALLRTSVRWAAKASDNGWDNAITYLGVTGLLVAFPVRWLFETHSVFWISLAPMVLWGGQLLALRLIYQISTARAFWVGLVHTVLTSTVIGTILVIAGVVIAYVLYGKIVSDPITAILIILKWLGISLPFLA